MPGKPQPNVWWPRAPYAKMIAQVLADHQWHSLDELYAKAAPVILDGQAWRKTEASRARALERKKAKGEPVIREDGSRHVQRSDDAIIRSGKRMMVLDAIHSARDRLEERYDDSGVRWLRLKDGQKVGFLQGASTSGPVSLSLVKDEEEQPPPEVEIPAANDKEAETTDAWKTRARLAEARIIRARKLVIRLLQELED